MKKTIAIVLLSCSVMSLFGCGGHDIVAVQETFGAWKAAVLATDGEKGAAQVDRATLHWWATAANHAATADQPTLEALEVNMILAVLRLRQAHTREELGKLTGKAACALAITKGWLGRGGLDTTELAEVRVSEDTAVATIAGDPKVVAWNFVREPEGWRIAMADRIALEAFALETEWAKSGVSRGAFALAKIRETQPDFSERLLISAASGE